MEHVGDQAIRRHRNGSIDINYYLKRGRIARSRAAYSFAAQLRRCVCTLVPRLLRAAAMSLIAHRTSIS